MASEWSREVPPQAVAVSREDREQWIRETVAAVQRGEDFKFVASGDSFVAAFRMDGDGEVFWVDGKLRREGTEPLAGVLRSQGDRTK